ncbi:sugar transferase [Hyphomicrobium sulfonivorans]|uniref:sugar transferase n=1 Tax=Hyphomicrobium sulfonivorans TaxID=121290 RepID=UPI0030B83C6F
MYANWGKRVFDVTLALLLALPALVLCVFCVVAIRQESFGPGLFKQARVGRNRKLFTLYKLRTMSAGTGDRASHEVAASQITRIGRILRRTKLDELPQLINVLKGDMSFVGPRPCLPNQESLIAERVSRDVFAIRPGITGAAQLAGIDMSTPTELSIVDARYRSDINFRSDLAYIIGTALGRGGGDAVKDG